MTPQERRAVKRLGEELEMIGARCRDVADPFAVVVGELALAVVRHAPVMQSEDAGPVHIGVVVERILAELRADAERRERDDPQRPLEYTDTGDGT